MAATISRDRVLNHRFISSGTRESDSPRFRGRVAAKGRVMQSGWFARLFFAVVAGVLAVAARERDGLHALGTTRAGDADRSPAPGRSTSTRLPEATPPETAMRLSRTGRLTKALAVLEARRTSDAPGRNRSLRPGTTTQPMARSSRSSSRRASPLNGTNYGSGPQERHVHRRRWARIRFSKTRARSGALGVYDARSRAAGAASAFSERLRRRDETYASGFEARYFSFDDIGRSFTSDSTFRRGKQSRRCRTSTASWWRAARFSCSSCQIHGNASASARFRCR